MASQITLIGLGQTGCSFGLAMKDETGQILRVGHDANPIAAQIAQQMGAVDQTRTNLHKAVEEAGAVLLCLPLDQVLVVLEQISPSLRPGTVVLDTAFSKTTVSAQARAVLPETCPYVGLLPVLNLESAEDETGHPDAVLLRGAPVYLAAPTGTPAPAVQLAADLIARVSASPIFIDIAELDGLTAKTVLLPALAAAGLLQAAALQPGWQEGRKTGAYPFAAATLALGLVPPKPLLAALQGDPQTALRLLDAAVDSLRSLRADIAAAQSGEGTGALAGLLERCEEERQNWWAARLTNNWDARPETPEINRAGLFSRLFGVGTKKRKAA